MFRYIAMCFTLSLVIIAAVDHNSVKKNNVQNPIVAVNPIQVSPVVPQKPPVVEKEPGDSVMWMNFPKQKTSNNSHYGPVLTDIVEHLPTKYGSRYNDRSLNTTGHETSHGISSELRNYHASGRNMNGFYCLNDKAAFIANPNITIAQIAQRVPQSLRLGRYRTYLIEQRKDWNDVPTYLLDEFNAYVNGAEVSIDQYKHGNKPTEHTDDIISPVEFSYYALAMCKTIDEVDPNYVGKEQFKEFVAYNIRRVARLYKEGIVLPELTWDSDLITTFNNSDLRTTAVKWYGEEFCKKYLDLKR
jgi:hypothetical protein